MLSSITPLPIDPGESGVLLFGGSFDPPHRGHVGLAEAARARCCPESALLFVPAARSPHKPRGPSAADGDRVRMLSLALEDVPRAGVWTDELDRAEADAPSYWVDTLERVRSVLGEERAVWFLIGADQARSLHRWAEPRRILELAEPIVLLRSPLDSVPALRASLVATGFWSESELDRIAAGAADVGTMDVSATEIRRLLGSDRDNARLESVLASGVLEYIRERGLYAGP